ncbi:YlxQ-related RNA-binding protein [Streptococcus saliviloxodontae]|uniref:Ribosomal protein L7Ae-like RNA K-turn-binding protein n=1 Tax=Streptococcus saliviloxodontae TaxID=1349416 RepID=A0ABS2PMI6_9STRE|nr:YlxQ-related RNA-binding protein [Streptococcus saliviloxodontae]MBM7636492.1 ribosomal protein L7Ae-like RNA K-turn-binding protein [Streptococcus saliviloxodontae]
MNNLSKLSNLLGLAQRAGRVISGEDLVVKAIQSNQVQLVFLANDAGPNLTKKITDKSNYYNIEVSTVFNTLELSSAIGKARKVVAIADAGFSKKMRTLMD